MNDSAKIRNITEGYLEGTSGIKSPQESKERVTPAEAAEILTDQILDPEKKKFLEDKLNAMKKTLSEIDKKSKSLTSDEVKIILDIIERINIQVRENNRLVKSEDLIILINQIYGKILSRLSPVV
jgi:hypothetical protein